MSNLRDEHAEPYLVGLVVASLVRLGRPARCDEICEAATTLDGSVLDVGTVRRLLDWLERALLIEEVGQGEWQLTNQLTEAFSPRGAKRLGPENHLAEVLAWAEETRGATGILEAVSLLSEADRELPPRVLAAAGELSQVEAPEALRCRYSLKSAFEALEGALPESFAIYRARRLTDKSPTLRELADKHGVSHERIRQREAQVEKFIDDHVYGSRESPLDPIGFASKRIRAEMGPLALSEEIASLSALVDPEGEALVGRPDRMALLLRLGGNYRIDGAWVVTPEIADVTDATLAALTVEGHTNLEAACRAMGELGIRHALQRPWIESRKGFRVLGDVLLRWGRSMADKSVAILGVAGEPLTMDDLYERLGEDKDFRSFKQQVQGDPRIRRRGLRHYGLEVWGGDEYTTIVDEMTEELERQGGSMPLVHLAETLAVNFGVSESSVRMYADGPQFEVDRDGNVTRRAGALPVPPSPPLEMTRGCFRLWEGWAYRRLVDRDVLRGSGGSLPIAFAKEIELEPGDSLCFQSPYAEIRCSWPSHMAHIGSLRLVAEALGAADGDVLFIVHVARERFDVRLATRQSLEATTGFDRLCLECGQKASSEPKRAVAEAVGIDPAHRDLATAIRLRLGERGERELASMVPAGTAGADVLDVLASLGE